MDVSDIVWLVVLIAVLFLAFRVGAFLMKGLLGLLAIAIVVWLVARLIGGGDPVPDAALLMGLTNLGGARPEVRLRR